MTSKVDATVGGSHLSEYGRIDELVGKRQNSDTLADWIHRCHVIDIHNRTDGRKSAASSFRQIPRRWATLETTGRCLLLLSILFLVVCVVMTAVDFGIGGSAIVVDDNTHTIALVQ